MRSIVHWGSVTDLSPGSDYSVSADFYLDFAHQIRKIDCDSDYSVFAGSC
jgi:hypothetical protein